MRIMPCPLPLSEFPCWGTGGAALGLCCPSDPARGTDCQGLREMKRATRAENTAMTADGPCLYKHRKGALFRNSS